MAFYPAMMDDRSRFWRYRSQWLKLGLLMLVFGGLLFLGLFQERQRIVKEQFQWLASHARMIDQNIARQIEGVDSALTAALRDVDQLHDRGADYQSLNSRLDVLSDVMPGVRTITVLDSAGDALASSRENLVGRNFSHRSYFTQAMQLADPQVVMLSPPFLTLLNVYSMNLTRVSVKAPGQVDMMATATLDPEFFKVLLSSVLFADDVSVEIIYSDGTLALRYPESPDSLGINQNWSGSVYSRFVTAGGVEQTLEGRTAPGGDEVWVALRSMKKDPLSPTGTMIVAVARDPVQALSTWQYLVRIAVAIWLTTLIASVILLLVYQERQARLSSLQEEKEEIRRQAELQIRQMAFYDDLTQLPNRRLFLERLDQVRASGARHGWHSALLFLDIDGFKKVNDTYGHEQGDRLLQEVARRLQAEIRREDTAARLAGDEFVVMLPELAGDLEQACRAAETVAQKILESLSQQYVFGAVSHRCTGSLGITLFGEGDDSIDEIIKRADRAMYAAKAAGRNTYRIEQSITHHASVQ